MRRLKIGSAAALVLIGMLSSVSAVRANTEPPAPYDARSVGMGSTGVAHVHNGASLYHNPAGLDGVEKAAFTLAIAPLAAQTTAPLAGPETAVKSERRILPMFLVGGAYRINERLTLGLAAYPTMGLGANYPSAPLLGGAKLNTQLRAIEIAPGASFAINHTFVVGLSYRVTYMSYLVEAPQVTPAGTVVNSKTDLSGWNFLGLQLGILARATKTTRLGLTYRNKVTANMNGSSDGGGLSLDSKAEFSAPHSFKVGVAQLLLNERLLLAFDLKWSLYHESSKNIAVKTTIPGLGEQTQTVALDWKNAWTASVGAEYRLAPEGPALRTGYTLIQSATSESRVQPTTVPPGLGHAIHFGAGMSLSKLDLDLGGYYLFGGKHVQTDGTAFPSGDYRMNALLGAVSATYRL